VSRFSFGFRFKGQTAGFTIPEAYDDEAISRAHAAGLRCNGAACGNDTGLGPKHLLERPRERPPESEPPSASSTFLVRPILAHLLDIAPGNTVQLSVATYDSTGIQSLDAGAATYSSSDPTIASVSSGGVVTAVRPGVAVIAAALGGTRETAFMTATVHRGEEAPGPYPDIGGVYDLTASITSSDPAWGIEDGTRHTGIIVIRHPRDASAFAGSYSDFIAISSNGDSSDPRYSVPGFVTGSVDLDGRVVIELFSGQSQVSNWYGEGRLASGQIVGDFGAGGHISGTFTATRRTPE
jgi:hypothetical protein